MDSVKARAAAALVSLRKSGAVRSARMLLRLLGQDYPTEGALRRAITAAKKGAK